MNDWGPESCQPRHDWEYVDDEYGSLAEGGSYEIYRCRRCGRRKWVQLPD